MNESKLVPGKGRSGRVLREDDGRIQLTKERRQEIIKTFFADGEMIRPASKIAHCSIDTMKRVLSDAGIRWDTRTLNRDTRGKEAAVEKWSEILGGLQKEAYRGVCRVQRVAPPKLPCTGLFIPDAHGNYWNPEVTRKVLRDVGKVDVIVTNEVLTLDSHSFFRPSYKPDTISELKAIGGFFDMLAEKVSPENIIVTTSNHDSRFIKWIANNTSNFDQVETAAQAWQALFDKYVQLKMTLLPAPRVQIGTAIFSHPDHYILEQGRTAMREGTKCKLNYEAYGMQPPFEFVAVGHPHRLGMTMWQGERGFVAEAGCQCWTPRYAVDDTGVKPCTQFSMVNGAVKFTLDKHGKMVWDIGATGPIFAGFAGIPPEVE